ncbi:MAG: hypothetical protein J6D09_03115 [Clostridia bacterium]|nr:hypothetical protein [Clostridia bacterium]
MKTMAKRIVAGLLLVVMICAAFTSCAEKKDGIQLIFTKAGEYTYNTYTALSPSNWNELTYQDNNDTQIMSYIGSSFFGFDFKYDAEGKIVPGEFEIIYEAATKLEDVTAKYKEAWNIQGDKYMAYAITLRNDLKWDDGTAIKAEDFVYTMKEQLNPDFQNYRADSFYVGATIIANAKGYAKQGQAGLGAPTAETYSEDLDASLIFTLAAPGAIVNDKTLLEQCYLRTSMGFPASYDAAKCAAYLIANYLADSAFTAEVAAKMEGKTFAEIKADAEMKAAWDALIKWWQTEPNEELHFFLTDSEYPKVDWEKVGIFVGENEYEIVVVLEKALDLLDEEGNLTYKAAYNFASLPLVHKAKYEANKVEPVAGSTLWTSKYNSSVKTTASWGPYKLTFFQSGKAYILEKNENWYGYGVKENEGLYQTDRIVCETIKEWNTAWLKFQAGEIDGIGIDVSIAQDYKNSERAYFTPDDYVGSLQLQSMGEALSANEKDDNGNAQGIDKEILGYADFRKALSLSINRADYTAKCTTASKQGFGLFNSMHYYDVANGGVFRDTDEAKKVLCEVYNVDYTDTTKYPTLDDAVNAITGYDLDAAKALFTKAYNDAIAAGTMTADDKVELVFGTGAINESVQRHYDYLTTAWKEAVKGTPLEGKLTFKIQDFSDAWADDFMAGKYEICMGGWSGAAWDPGYFLLAYLDPGTAFSAGWDTTKQMMTFTMKGVGENGADITETMSLMEWYDCLNGATGAKYNWSSAALAESQRLQLIAALEKEVLLKGYSVPTYNTFSASLLSYKLDYVTYEYNTFMGYGGIKYMKFNMDDAGWRANVKAEDGKLNYK